MTEQQLIQMAKNGDCSAIEKLHKMHEGMIVSYIGRFVSSRVSFDDLLQESYITLIRAIDRYDESKDAKFLTYLTFLLNKDFHVYSLKDTPVYVPSNKKLKLNALRNSTEEDKNISKEDEEFLSRMFAETNSKMYDSISKEDVSFEDEIILSDAIRSALQSLDKPHWADIIELKFGLNNKRVHTIKEIGAKYNKTKQWASMEIQKGLNKLKYSKYLKDYK